MTASSEDTRGVEGYVNCTRTNAELEQNIWEEISALPREIMWPHNGNFRSTVQGCIYLYGRSYLSGLVSKNLTLCIKCFVKNNSKCVFVVIFISKLSGYSATPSVNLYSVGDMFQFQTAEELRIYGQLSRSAGGNA